MNDQPELDERDWLEIYYALTSKLKALCEGEYGAPEEEEVAAWIAHIEEIIETIGPDGERMYA